MMHGSSRNVSRLLTDSASRYPERTAIVLGGDRITYAESSSTSSPRQHGSRSSSGSSRKPYSTR